MSNSQPASIADLLTEHLSSAGFVRAVLSGPRTPGVPWHRVVVRPVLVSGHRRIQLQRYDAKHCDTVNVDEATDPVVLDVVRLPFRYLTIQLVDQRIDARQTKRGRVLSSVVRESADVRLRHDRPKKRWIPEDAEFLSVLGMAGRGRVHGAHARKYRQIQEFVRAIAESAAFGRTRTEPVRVVDFGCGNAYLTFATFHYLAVELGLRCELLGIDRDAGAIARNRANAELLGWTTLCFEQAGIAEARILKRPTIVLALHACDTATDDAIARAVTAGAEMILAAPCCHHHIQAQLSRVGAPGGMTAIARNDLLRERIGDVLTDGARVALLNLAGYRTKVLQFATLTDTAKNLLIRAERTGEPPSSAQAAEYAALKSAWGITPYLESRLAVGPASPANG